MAFEEDLGVFFDDDEFGTLAVYRAAGTGSPVDVVGIFDNGFATSSLGGLAGEAREIIFRCALADLPAADQGDTIRIDGTTYRVRSVRPDGTGVLILVLAV